MDCRYTSIHNCRHSEDVGISCKAECEFIYGLFIEFIVTYVYRAMYHTAGGLLTRFFLCRIRNTELIKHTQPHRYVTL